MENRSLDLLDTASAVRRAATQLTRRLRAERAEGSLTLAKISVLAHLYRAGEMTASELAAAERLQPQSLSRVLAELARDTLVFRVQSAEDRRQFRILLTAAGLEALGHDMHQRDTWLAQVMERDLTPTEREVLRLAGRLMEQLAAAPSPDTVLSVPPKRWRADDPASALDVENAEPDEE